MKIRTETPFEDATLEVAAESDEMAAELFRLSMPLVLGVFPALTFSDYWALTTRQHITFAKVAARMNPRLLEACDLTMQDLGLSEVADVEP